MCIHEGVSVSGVRFDQINKWSKQRQQTLNEQQQLKAKIAHLKRWNEYENLGQIAMREREKAGEFSPEPHRDKFTNTKRA